MILGILGFCFLLIVLYQCSKSSEVAEYDDYQENGVKQDNNMEPSIYSLGVTSENQIERQENNSFNPTPGEANGKQNGSEPAYAGGWVNQSYKHTE